MKRLVLLCGILVSSISAKAASEINNVKTKSEGKAFTAIYSVSEPIEEKDLKVNYRPRSIEMIFSGSSLPEKSIVRVDHPIVDRVYSASRDGEVFSRIIFKEGLVARDFEKKVSFEVKENKIFLNVAEKDFVPAVAKDLDEALDNEVAKILAQDMPEKIIAKDISESEVIPEDKEAILKESEIPVLTKAEEKKVEAESPYSRLAMSLIVIVLFGAAMAMLTRWWKKRGTQSTDTNKIRVVSQHFLGPRKSLAIIRVSGETMLIGVTDHNINMIKSLSLLDDEATSFDQVLGAQTGQIQQVAATNEVAVMEEEEEDFTFRQIKDRISNRIKEMRPL